jgi:hypothetical protein
MLQDTATDKLLYINCLQYSQLLSSLENIAHVQIRLFLDMKVHNLNPFAKDFVQFVCVRLQKRWRNMHLIDSELYCVQRRDFSSVLNKLLSKIRY